MRNRAGLFAACSLLLLPAPASAKTWVVHPGDSIQAAVDGASPGDSIKVMPGTYREPGRPCPLGDHTCAVVVTKPRISLEAHAKKKKKRVVLENPGGQDQGIAIAPEGANGATCLYDESQRLSRVSVRGFTVNGFDGEGIFLFCVDRFDVRFNETNDNAEYGIFPSHSTRGRVAFNVATGSHDTCSARRSTSSPIPTATASSTTPLVAPEFAKDLAWDGTGDGNCWKKNKSQTQFPDTLPACQ